MFISPVTSWETSRRESLLTVVRGPRVTDSKGASEDAGASQEVLRVFMRVRGRIWSWSLLEGPYGRLGVLNVLRTLCQFRVTVLNESSVSQPAAPVTAKGALKDLFSLSTRSPLRPLQGSLPACRLLGLLRRGAIHEQRRTVTYQQRESPDEGAGDLDGLP